VQSAGAATRNPGSMGIRRPFIWIAEPLVEERSWIRRPDSPTPNSRCVRDTERVSSARVIRCFDFLTAGGGRVAPD
jgi:hypothetical protein